MSEKKKFGLVVPQKATTLKTRVSSVFNDESDDEPEVGKRPRIPQKKMTQKKSLKIESDIDPSIYEYDSIYDEMKTKQAESRGPKEVQKSRYIETLLKAADKRKREHERRIDRKIQIEREKEGDQFKDKEEFVTSTYKKKLQEKEEEEERERRENMLNDMMDVTKQKDLSGFYRHFLNQTVGEEKVPLFGEKQIKREVESDENVSLKKVGEKKIKKEVESDENVFIKKDDENLDQDSDGIEIDREDDDSERDFSDTKKSSDQEKKETAFKKRKCQSKERKKVFRKKSSESVSENLGKSKSLIQDETCAKKCGINSNSDISSSENESNEAKKSSYSDKNKKKSTNNMNKLNHRHDSSSSDDDSRSESMQTNISKEEKQKNIYAKRTVGDVFAEAQVRYFQRMAMRNS